MTTTSRPARPGRAMPHNSAPRPTAVRVTEEQEDDFEEETSAAEAQELEADTDGHYVTATLAGEPIRIIPPGAWRQSWQTKLARGQFNAFAEEVVHPDDLDLYFDIDPTNDEFEQFVTDAANMSGESLGKSRGPSRSSRRTRKR